MSIQVRPADITDDRSALVGFLLAYLSPYADDRRFEWLYRSNPHGEARVWIATVPEERKIIGVAAAFPRRLFDCGREAKGFVLGDFCVHPDHRTMGPALALQRACLNGLAAEADTLAYDFPSAAMLSVYKRLQIEAQEQIIRFAKILRVDRKVGGALPAGAARGLSAVLNLGLRLWDGVRRIRGDWSFSVESGPWGDEFTARSLDWSQSLGVSIARTAEYLNWRYAQNPVRQYTMLTARLGGRLSGYLVFHVDRQYGVVDELLAGDDLVREALLLKAIAVARRQGLYTLSVPSLSCQSDRRALRSCGFRPRESSPVILLRLSQQTPHAVPHRGHWYLADGDRES